MQNYLHESKLPKKPYFLNKLYSILKNYKPTSIFIFLNILVIEFIWNFYINFVM